MNVAESHGVYFLDTSALVKLYHQERGTEIVEALAAEPTAQLWISDLARAEFHSTFVRKVLEGELDAAQFDAVAECFRDDV